MNKTIWILGIIIVIVLAGGAYFGAQALASQKESSEVVIDPPNTDDGLSGLIIDGEGGEFPESGIVTEVEVETASELPETEPDAFGFVLEREDDTFLLGTGEPKISMEIGEDGTPNIKITGTEGPTIEVVITRDTQLLEDASDMTALATGGSGSMKQEVKTIDSLDDVSDDAQMVVWGTKRGERVIADVVLVIPPFVASGPVQP